MTHEHEHLIGRRCETSCSYSEDVEYVLCLSQQRSVEECGSYGYLLFPYSALLANSGDVCGYCFPPSFSPLFPFFPPDHTKTETKHAVHFRGCDFSCLWLIKIFHWRDWSRPSVTGESDVLSKALTELCQLYLTTAFLIVIVFNWVASGFYLFFAVLKDMTSLVWFSRAINEVWTKSPLRNMLNGKHEVYKTATRNPHESYTQASIPFLSRNQLFYGRFWLKLHFTKQWTTSIPQSSVIDFHYILWWQLFVSATIYADVRSVRVCVWVGVGGVLLWWKMYCSKKKRVKSEIDTNNWCVQRYARTRIICFGEKATLVRKQTT